MGGDETMVMDTLGKRMQVSSGTSVSAGVCAATDRKAGGSVVVPLPDVEVCESLRQNPILSVSRIVRGSAGCRCKSATGAGSAGSRDS